MAKRKAPSAKMVTLRLYGETLRFYEAWAKLAGVPTDILLSIIVARQVLIWKQARGKEGLGK